MSQAMCQLYGLRGPSPYGDMDYGDQGGFDWGSYVRDVTRTGLDIIGAVATEQPYYTYNPNVATSRTETQFPVYDTRVGGAPRVQYPMYEPGREAGLTASRGGFNLQVSWPLIAGAGLLLGVFLVGRRR